MHRCRGQTLRGRVHRCIQCRQPEFGAQPGTTASSQRASDEALRQVMLDGPDRDGVVRWQCSRPGKSIAARGRLRCVTIWPAVCRVG